MAPKNRVTPEEALAYHLNPVPGKYEINATKPMMSQRDLSLAYSPGVAVPVQAIADAPETRPSGGVRPVHRSCRSTPLSYLARMTLAPQQSVDGVSTILYH